ncbi:MAG: quinone-dependent dihydroorotate dehydrogenase [Pseudobdellovibrionaceae bacterium]
MTKPWFLIPAAWAHSLSPWVLPIYSRLQKDFIAQDPKKFLWRPLVWKGLNFRNPLGIAGGVDKNADNILDWLRLGIGFAEVGTITPMPQTANPGIIMDRDLATQSLWNKMGFPNEGCEEILYNLLEIKSDLQKNRAPLFVNIGKNRSTSNEEAIKDYIFCVQKLSVVADVFVINISSPNTQGLRQLQHAEVLQKLLRDMVLYKQNHKITQPLLLKLSPDMGESDFQQTLQIAVQEGIDGFILTNTTLQREKDSPFPAEGGVSGEPLQKLSLKYLELANKVLDPVRRDVLLVSVGGVLTPQQALDRLNAGADLVQTYSGLIFYGPDFFISAARKAKVNEFGNKIPS